MGILSLILAGGFVVSVLWLAQRSFFLREEAIKKEIRQMQDSLVDFNSRREKDRRERQGLEKAANEIFALYEMAREMTKSLNEEHVFRVFKKKLKETVSFEKCSYIDSRLTDQTEPQPREGEIVFKIQGEKSQIGSVIFSGVGQEDRDKAAILTSQLALALRRIKLYQEVELMAMTDPLTGVYNRRYFMDRFEAELKRSSFRSLNLTFFMVDVDHFKSFNDRYGHLVGDQILKDISTLIKNNVREIDFVGRFGGEEFSIVLPDTAAQGALLVAERIRSAIEQGAIQAYDLTVKTTVSIGLAVFPSHSRQMKELIEKADWALYRAKKNGRNQICSFGL